MTFTLSAVPIPYEESPRKTAKEESSLLVGMAKVVNKPQQKGEDVTP